LAAALFPIAAAAIPFELGKLSKKFSKLRFWLSSVQSSFSAVGGSKPSVTIIKI
jgi:hypothetical protein